MLCFHEAFSPMSPQFVPFRDYMDRTGNHVLSMARLAKDVLAEIPDQLISYMKSRGIKPNPPPPPYSSVNHLQANPVWAPTAAPPAGEVGVCRTKEPAAAAVEKVWKDDETPFCSGAMRWDEMALGGKLLVIRELFSPPEGECLRLRALRGVRCKGKVLVVRCQTCHSGNVMDSKWTSRERLFEGINILECASVYHVCDTFRNRCVWN